MHTKDPEERRKKTSRIIPMQYGPIDSASPSEGRVVALPLVERDMHTKDPEERRKKTSRIIPVQYGPIDSASPLEGRLVALPLVERDMHTKDPEERRKKASRVLNPEYTNHTRQALQQEKQHEVASDESSFEEVDDTDDDNWWSPSAEDNLSSSDYDSYTPYSSPVGLEKAQVAELAGQLLIQDINNSNRNIDLRPPLSKDASEPYITTSDQSNLGTLPPKGIEDIANNNTETDLRPSISTDDLKPCISTSDQLTIGTLPPKGIEDITNSNTDTDLRPSVSTDDGQPCIPTSDQLSNIIILSVPYEDITNSNTDTDLRPSVSTDDGQPCISTSDQSTNITNLPVHFENSNNEVPATHSTQPSSVVEDRPILTNEVLVVDQAKRNPKRVFDRKDCCIFCEKFVTNFTRHLQRNHNSEMEVNRIMALSKGSKERRLEFDKLRKKGNFYYNSRAIQEKSGNIIVVKRPNEKCDPRHFLPCKFCLGFFSRRTLYRHVQQCKSNNSITTNRGNRTIQAAGANLLMTNPGCSIQLKNEVFSIMKQDSITDIVRQDDLICLYGTQLMKNHKDKHMKVYVSQKMRELGRLVYKLKSDHQKMLQLSDFINPEKYDNIVSAVKDIAGYDEVEGSFRIPSLAKKLGHSLKTCASILECKAISSGNEKIEKAASKFMTIMDRQWQYDISCGALNTLNKAKWNKPTLLPLADDLQAMQTFLLKKETELAKQLKLHPSTELWRELSEVTLLHVILLNRRRCGEVERILLAHYTERDKSEHCAEVLQSLSETEKTLCKHFTRFETRGKRGRKVPVLLTPGMKQNFDLLVTTRQVVNVLPTNPYFFAIPGYEQSTLRGSHIVKKYADICGAKQPGSLTSTKLRKHVATMSQVLHLSPNEMEQLASFMGHNISIHQNYYRLPENTIQVAKISKILLMMEKGELKNLHGKSLDSVDVQVDDCSNSESEEEELQQTSMNSVDETSSYDLHSQTVPPESTHGDTVVRRTPKRRKTSCKNPWSLEEKAAVKRHFEKHIIMKKVPNKRECDSCIQQEPALHSRSWSNVKFCVKNMFPK